MKDGPWDEIVLEYLGGLTGDKTGMWLQAGTGVPTTPGGWKRGGTTPPCGLWRERRPADTLMPDFWSLKLWKNKFLLFLKVKLVVICYGSSSLSQRSDLNLVIEDFYSHMSSKTVWPWELWCSLFSPCQHSRRVGRLRTESTPLPAFVNKFYWDTAMPIHLVSPTAAFALQAGLSSCDTVSLACKI